MQQSGMYQHPPQPDLERFRAQARAEWMDPATLDAWQRWHPHLTLMLRDLTEAMVAAANFRPGQQVLDLACGSGEPALSIAPLVEPAGQVVATDFAEGMVAIARENARRLGLGNVSFRDADAEALPFDDGSFDRVTCRLGIMHLSDPARAQREIHRVLRPMGRAVEVVWGEPERHQPIQLVFGPVLSRVTMPPPDPEAPSPFRFAQSGSLSNSLRAAGFREVREERREVQLVWRGTPETMWEAFRGLAAPVRMLFEGLPTAERAAVEAEVLEGLRSRTAHGQIHLAAEIVVGTGVA